VWQEVDPGERRVRVLSSAGAEGKERNTTRSLRSFRSSHSGLHLATLQNELEPNGITWPSSWRSVACTGWILTTWTLRLPVQTCVSAAGDDQVIKMRNYGTGLTPVVAIHPGTIESPALSPAASAARHPLPHFQLLQRFRSTYTWSGVSQTTPPQYSA